MFDQDSQIINVEDLVWDEARTKALNQLPKDIWDQVRIQVGNQVLIQVWDSSSGSSLGDYKCSIKKINL